MWEWRRKNLFVLYKFIWVKKKKIYKCKKMIYRRWVCYVIIFRTPDDSVYNVWLYTWTTFLYGKDESEIATTRIWVNVHCGSAGDPLHAKPSRRCIAPINVLSSTIYIYIHVIHIHCTYINWSRAQIIFIKHTYHCIHNNT